MEVIFEQDWKKCNKSVIERFHQSSLKCFPPIQVILVLTKETLDLIKILEKCYLEKQQQQKIYWCCPISIPVDNGQVKDAVDAR